MKKRDTILIAIAVFLLAFPYLIGIGSVIWENIPEKRNRFHLKVFTKWRSNNYFQHSYL